MNENHNCFVNIITQNEDAQTIIDLFQLEINKKGSDIYPLILSTLTSLELDAKDAQYHWQQIILNWQALSNKLGRKVSLQTAVCDYFNTIHATIKSPKIIDIRLYEKTLLNSHIDELTGLYNRRFGDEILEREVSHSMRHNQDISLIFFDIDNFKEINDTYSHAAGDLYLIEIAKIISKLKRVEDVAIRFGGEEILLLLRKTDGREALIIGNRILKEVANLELNYEGHTISTTMSGGLASCPIHGETVKELLKSGDIALYQAKGAGKNTILFSTIDKRRCLRVELFAPIIIKKFDFNYENVIEANGQDISLSGIRFQTNMQLKLGMKIQLQLHLPKHKQLQVIAEIVRIEKLPDGSNNIGAALCYKKMHQSSQDTISDYVSEIISDD